MLSEEKIQRFMKEVMVPLVRHCGIYVSGLQVSEYNFSPLLLMRS